MPRHVAFPRGVIPQNARMPGLRRAYGSGSATRTFDTMRRCATLRRP